ncbi:MAG TPA: hypothetical protein VGM80_15385 [Gaiellaceae bacterium]|jgi:hypothetical protein
MSEQAIEHEVLAGTELELQNESDIEIYCWRMEQLLNAGYAHVLADALATDLRVDLHRACDLLAYGCPQAVAYRIVS